MGIAHRSIAPMACTVSVWDGVVTADDVTNHIIAVAEDREWPPGSLHLSDLSTLRQAAIPDRELVALLYEGTNLDRTLKIAVVVRRVPQFAPDQRTAEALQSMRAVTFDDFGTACAYLGVPLDPTESIITDLRQELAARSTDERGG